MASQWFETRDISVKGTIGSDRELLVGRIASPQRHLIRLDQLHAAGLSRNTVSDWVRAGRLHRLHRGVFALHPPPYDRRQQLLAAVYACGPASAVSHLCAAALLSLVDDHPALIDVAVPTQRGRKLPGINAHRLPLPAHDRAAVGGIPCTSAARTLIDIAPLLDDDALEDALITADSLRILNRRRLDELIAERCGRPGLARLAALISDDPVEARSRNERRMLSICREFNIPRPLVNHRIEADGRTFYADFCWPELRLIVEADSWRWHGGRSANESDRDRDQLLMMAGWRIVHFTRDQIVHRRAETGNRLVALTQLPGVTR
jgi:predicted transcriptional regulator of viral defense system